MQTINILGVKYEILDQTEAENKKLQNANGLCEYYAHRLIINTEHKDDLENFDNIADYYHKVLRHEAFHAIFAEMGMRDWIEDEQLVDMLAMQYPKIKVIMDKLDAMDIFKL